MKRKRTAEQAIENFIQAALENFLKAGYAKAKMREIILGGGGSLSTLYKLFGSKEALFERALGELIAKSRTDFEQFTRDREDLPAQEFFISVARYILEFTLSDRAILLNRLIYGEGHKNNAKLSKMIFGLGFGMLPDVISEHIKKRQKRGELKAIDALTAAWRFIYIVREPYGTLRLALNDRAPTQKEMDAIAVDAAKFFLGGMNA